MSIHLKYIALLTITGAEIISGISILPLENLFYVLYIYEFMFYLC